MRDVSACDDATFSQGIKSKQMWILFASACSVHKMTLQTGVNLKLILGNCAHCAYDYASQYTLQRCEQHALWELEKDPY